MSDAITPQAGVGIVLLSKAAQRVVNHVVKQTGIPQPGPGYLAGTSPAGITSVLGVPASATIRVMYRPAAGALGDGVLVATTTSAADGSWRVDNLDPALKFDLVCRKAGYNDLIWANVSPTPY